ncbi:hypothetical protein [Kitasatospora sp. NPDC096140]|uniref:hypothetical protein n=1 Tax=Kitasatospora sp. NPDC096140 TaxID=3155425 RepID=UPI003321DB6E
MTGTGIKGRGQETHDAVLAAVLGGLTATIDGWLLSSFRNGAQAANRQRDAVNSALVLATPVLFAALPGSLVGPSGRCRRGRPGPTPQAEPRPRGPESAR